MNALRLYLWLVWVHLLRAQDYSIPNQWINTSSSLSRNERIQLAKGLFRTLDSSYDLNSGLILDLGYGQNANLLSATTIYDSIVPGSETSNYNVTTDRLNRAIAGIIPARGPFSNDPIMWGLTAIYAYRAYQQRPFLALAAQIWEAYTPWVINEADAANGSHPLKNVTFQSECNGTSVAGGVFWNIDEPSSTGIIAGGEGAYMALSAYLYDITDNQTYYDATVMTYTFIDSHIFNEAKGYVMDSFLVQTCVGDDPLVMTYNTGLYLEALSLFANKTANTTLVQKADQLALSAIKSSEWTASNGILIDTHAPQNLSDNSHADTAYKGMLVRALYEHWSRSPPNSDIANLIKAYLILQYNAVINNARTPGKDWYSQNWTGPSVPSMLPWGQLAAADVLNSAIGLAADPSPIPIPSSSGLGPSDTSSVSPHSQPHLPIGSIVGGAVGGFLGVVFLSIIILVVRCRRQRKTRFKRTMLESFEHLPRSLNPFPPPVPIIDLFNSSKLRNEIQEPAVVPPQIEPMIAASGPQNQMGPTRPDSESNNSSRDNIQDLVDRLNRAVANLPPPSVDSSSNAAPPRYQSIA